MNKLKGILLKLKNLFSIKTAKRILNTIIQIASFVILLATYLWMRTIAKFTSSRLCPTPVTNAILPPCTKIYNKIVSLNRHNENTINRVNLIELAFKNMQFKLTRTLITIGGMSVGIAAIVFLVSVGYGVEQLVTSRVARLDELKQADVSTQPGSNIRITDETVSDFKNISDVELSLPLIALVGKVTFSGSVTDMAAYGVTTEFLRQSAIRPVQGELFENDDLSFIYDNSQAPSVAGIFDEAPPEVGQVIQQVEFEIHPGEWLEVKEEPSVDSETLGYTKRAEGIQTGVELWGLGYQDPVNGKVVKGDNGQWYGKWIKTKVYVWDQDERQMVEKRDDDGNLVQEEGFLKESGMNISRFTISEQTVLGILDTAEAQEATESTSSGPNIVELEDGWVILEGEGDEAEEENVKTVQLGANSTREAVVNRAMLNVLGMSEEDAVGEEFEVSFIVTSDLLGDETDKLQSEIARYTIVGVIPQDDTPFFYVPFADLRSLGVTSYSQVKVVSSGTDALGSVREKIEAMGYLTTSVTDTVSQINTLFGTVRRILALIGTVALIVAALGMFNTLTVSLLERTREIGLMKALGMKSHEVEELFLTESMVMGIFGGALGIVLGFLAGKLLGLLLSIVAIAQGVGYIDVAHLPFTFVLLIMGLSMVVGLITGIYPARRATKISALNALRYE